jgi:hypothetical protein
MCQEVAACKLHFLTHSSTYDGVLHAQVMCLMFIHTQWSGWSETKACTVVYSVVITNN